MKRWTIILGRAGTTLIAISLALLLVSIIPQPRIATSSGSVSLSPDAVAVAFNHPNLTPQMTLNVSVTTEGRSLKVYILETNLKFDTTTGRYGFNSTDLQQLVNEHPEKVLWQQIIEGSYERTYSPTRIINATVVVYNPTSENATLNYEVTLTSSLAPENKVQNIAYWIAPIGIVLALPWIITIWIQRTHK